MIGSFFLMFESLQMLTTFLILQYEKEAHKSLSHKQRNVDERIRVHRLKYIYTGVGLFLVMVLGTLFLMFNEDHTFIQAWYSIIQTVSVMKTEILYENILLITYA